MTERRPGPFEVGVFLAVLAAGLAAVVFAAMLLLTGVWQAVAVYGAVAAQVALLVTRARADRPGRVPLFVGVWSTEAGLTYLWAGDDTAASALVYILVGVVFAAVATWVLSLAARVEEHDDPAPPADTRPLPVAGAEEERDR